MTEKMRERLRNLNIKQNNILGTSINEDLERVKQDWRNLQYIENQTNEVCIEAVMQNPRAIDYVKNKTPEIYLKMFENCFGFSQIILAG